MIELELLANGTNKDSSSAREKLSEHKVKRKKRTSLTREGCMACCTFKRTLEDKYEIFKIHEGHTYPLATPSKKSMLKSARNVNPMLKNVLRVCHRNNIGTSKAFNLMKEQLQGLANVGCVKRDFIVT